MHCGRREYQILGSEWKPIECTPSGHPTIKICQEPELPPLVYPPEILLAAAAGRDESDTESDDEAFQRKRNRVSPLDLGQVPTSGGLRQWLNVTMVSCCASSNRPKRRTLRYITGVTQAKTVTQLENISKRWDQFDTELCSAVLKVANGAAKRELALYQESRQACGYPMSGRAALFLLIKRLKVVTGSMLQIEMQSLLALEFKGDMNNS